MKINLDEHIEIPEKVTVEIDKSLIKIKGDKGEIETRLVETESIDAMKYYQGVLRALEWVTTGTDV